MNQWVTVLERAIEKTSADNAEGRAAIYARARTTLEKHFSDAGAPIAANDHDAASRNLEDAIGIIEARAALDTGPSRTAGGTAKSPGIRQ